MRRRSSDKSRIAQSLCVANRQRLPVMRGREIDRRPGGHDTRGIDAAMTLIIVSLDVLSIDGFRKAGGLVKIPSVGPEVRVIDDAFQIALEVSKVHQIESHERREQTNIGLGEPVTNQKALPAESLF